MAERENLPAAIAGQAIAVPTEQRGSLVARGLAALRKDNDALYRQARAVFDRVDAIRSWTTAGNPTISSAFKIFQKLADDNYGKAYSPLSIFIYFQNIAERAARSSYYMHMAADWLDSQSDEDAWCYMGHMYVSGCAVAQDDRQAVHCFRKAAEQGSALGQSLLGEMYESGRGVAQDDEQAAYWYRKAAEQDNATAQWLLAGMYEYGRGVIPNIEEAVSWYRKSAKNGGERALKDLGDINEIGRGGALDEEQAVYWNQKSAEKGHIWAMINLGAMYENGLRVEQNDEQALFWYRKAAEQGYPWSEVDFGADRFFELGMRYRYGDDGTQVNNEKAREYFGEAAELDHVEAQLELARLLFDLGEHADAQLWLDDLILQGYGPAIHYLVVEHDGLCGGDAEEVLLQASKWYESCVLETGDAKRQFEFSEILFLFYSDQDGLRWLKASAEQDYTEACYRLGHEYLRGKVSEYSTQQGIYWLSRAAELGRLSAYEDLGDLYLLGHGRAPNQWTSPTPRIAPDKVAAVAWYERAIAKGMRRTAYKLGCHYLKGVHLDQDLFLTEKWLLHAAQEGSSSAQQTLGEEYASGLRLRKDANSAIHWLKLAAQSYKSVGLKLAEIFADGIITPVNFGEALRWLQHATASRGFQKEAEKVVTEKFCDGRFSTEQEAAAKACLTEMANRARALVADDEHPQFFLHAFDLAKHYELGIGVEQDMNEAIRWYKVSAAEGSSYGAQKRLKELGIDWKTP